MSGLTRLSLECDDDTITAVSMSRSDRIVEWSCIIERTIVANLDKIKTVRPVEVVIPLFRSQTLRGLRFDFSPRHSNSQCPGSTLKLPGFLHDETHSPIVFDHCQYCRLGHLLHPASGESSASADFFKLSLVYGTSYSTR